MSYKVLGINQSVLGCMSVYIRCCLHPKPSLQLNTHCKVSCFSRMSCQRLLGKILCCSWMSRFFGTPFENHCCSGRQRYTGGKDACCCLPSSRASFGDHSAACPSEICTQHGLRTARRAKLILLASASVFLCDVPLTVRMQPALEYRFTHQLERNRSYS